MESSKKRRRNKQDRVKDRLDDTVEDSMKHTMKHPMKDTLQEHTTKDTLEQHIVKDTLEQHIAKDTLEERLKEGIVREHPQRQGFNPEKHTLGYLERGITFTYVLDESYNETAVFSWWGALLISGVPMGRVIRCATLSRSLGLSIVDNIDDNTIVAKLDVGNANIPISEGNTPCIYSQAEVIECPLGNWHHFSSYLDRDLLYWRINDIYNALPDSKVYLIARMYPTIELIYFMNEAEMEQVLKREKK